MQVDCASWTSVERDLWARIAAHVFEMEGVALTFVDRLARDHEWSMAFARGAVEEYRRFCFLAMTTASQVTPSEEVDEVWHLHLTFSQDYWNLWCGRVLRLPFHHQPTLGGQAEGIRFAEQYARTLARYEERFGPPDVRFWPGTARRFGDRPRYRTVDRDRAIVVFFPLCLRRWSGMHSTFVHRMRHRMQATLTRSRP